MNLEDSVLLLLLRFNRAEDISEALNVRIEDVEAVLKRLESEGFVERKKKGFLLKKDVFELTERGFEKAVELRKNLEEVARDLERVHEKDPERAAKIIEKDPLLLPLLITLGLINLSMLSGLAEEDYDFDFDFDTVEF